MDQFVVRNIKQRETLVDQLRDYRLPFKGMLQGIYPQRSPEANAYLWGVVYRYISDYTGHTPMEIHKEYKRRLNVAYWPEPKTIHWRLRIRSTTEFDTITFEQYCLMVRADAEIELRITIPLPNEVFINNQKPQT